MGEKRRGGRGEEGKGQRSEEGRGRVRRGRVKGLSPPFVCGEGKGGVSAEVEEREGSFSVDIFSGYLFTQSTILFTTLQSKIYLKYILKQNKNK